MVLERTDSTLGPGKTTCPRTRVACFPVPAAHLTDCRVTTDTPPWPPSPVLKTPDAEPPPRSFYLTRSQQPGPAASETYWLASRASQQPRVQSARKGAREVLKPSE